jgi:DNA polymerase III subunit epsilon
MNKTLKAVIVEVKGGNTRNNHINLRGAFGLFPTDSLGGRNKSEAGKAVEVEIGRFKAMTDIDSTKAIFRARSEVGKFLKDEGISEGDHVLVQRVSPRSYRVSRVSASSIAKFI